MKFAKGRTQSVQEPQHTLSSGAASAALQQSPLMQQQAAQLMAIRQSAQQQFQRKQLTDVASQNMSLVGEEPLQGKFEAAAVSQRPAETGDASQLKQFKKNPDQKSSKVVQLAIKSANEATPGTIIMVVNTSANDAGDVGRVVRQSNSKPNCMVVEFDNQKGVLYRVYFNEIDVIPTTDDVVHSTEKAQLKLMMDQAIVAASDAADELNAVMSTDKTGTHGKIITPADQLKKCLSDCKNLSAEETATYLYTTYFYGPLNKYLRSPEVKFQSAVVQRLVDITHAFLQRAFNATPGAAQLPKFRMELQAEWIDKVATKTGDALSFRAFTSTHPELEGVNAMWEDIESGTFGEVTKLALLVFQGTSKFLYPSTKYFPSENEHILPPEMHTHISEKYQIHWHDWTVTVYHLTVVGSGDVEQIELDFDKDGNVYRKK